MTRDEILTAIKRYFDIDELVCDHTYKKWGEKAWQFLDTDYLHALLIIRRDIIRLPMWCNGNGKKQRGLRCNMCEEVKKKREVYLSSHVLGKAGDFTITGMSAEAARKYIKENKPDVIQWDANGNEISWVHIDTIDAGPQQPKVYEFKA